MNAKEIIRCLKNMNKENPAIDCLVSEYVATPSDENLERIMIEIKNSIMVRHVYERLTLREKELLECRYVLGLTELETASLLQKKYYTEKPQKTIRKGEYKTPSTVKAATHDLIHKKIMPGIDKMLTQTISKDNKYCTVTDVENILKAGLDKKALKKEVLWAEEFYNKTYEKIQEKMPELMASKYMTAKNKVIERIYSPLIEKAEKTEKIKDEVRLLDEKTRQMIVDKYVVGQSYTIIAENLGFDFEQRKAFWREMRRIIKKIAKKYNDSVDAELSAQKDLIA